MESEAIVQAYARLTVHEFALEVVMANWLADRPEAEANAFLDDFKNRFSMPWSAAMPATDDTTTQRMIADSRELGANLAEKVRRRAAGIRAARPR
jgi:hypothetical protein